MSNVGDINVLLAVGNSMMGDDGAGPLLAEMMQNQPVPGWVAIDGGSMPENMVHQIKKLNPKRVLIFDAADLQLEAGELSFVEKEQISNMFIMSTHNLPLSFLMEELEQDIEEVIFLGVQPETVAFYYPMSEKIKNAVEKVHRDLASGLKSIPWLK